jgi:NAD+ synthase
VVESIINKPPSADLWDGQSDEEEIGFSYAQIDRAFYGLVEERRSKEEMIEEGFDEEFIEMLQKRLYQNQFKRKPPVIAKVTTRTIGIDFLYPRDIKL